MRHIEGHCANKHIAVGSTVSEGALLDHQTLSDVNTLLVFWIIFSNKETERRPVSSPEIPWTSAYTTRIYFETCVSIISMREKERVDVRVK